MTGFGGLRSLPFWGFCSSPCLLLHSINLSWFIYVGRCVISVWIQKSRSASWSFLASWIPLKPAVHFGCIKVFGCCAWAPRHTSSYWVKTWKHGHTVDGGEIRITRWKRCCIPSWFIGFKEDSTIQGDTGFRHRPQCVLLYHIYIYLYDIWYIYISIYIYIYHISYIYIHIRMIYMIFQYNIQLRRIWHGWNMLFPFVSRISADHHDHPTFWSPFRACGSHGPWSSRCFF